MFEAVTNQFQAKTFMSKSYSDMKFFSFLSDPTKKSIKIPNSKLRYALCCPLSRPLQLMKTCQSSIKQSTQHRCFDCMLECPITKYNSIALHTFGRSDTYEFFYHLMREKIPCNAYKGFLWKKSAKVVRFWGFFLEIIRFDQQVPTLCKI
jgi:hypothetical protein